MKKVIILFGKPGAGKGTRLSEVLEKNKEQYEVLSVGNLLRSAIRNQTRLGQEVASYMEEGTLVPDKTINSLVIEGIRSAKMDVIIDGFPRTLGQAEAMLASKVYPDKVIELSVDDDVVIQRAKDRIVCDNCGESYTTNTYKPPKVEGICDKCGGILSRRKDDEEDVVKKRLAIYQVETHPVLGFLKYSGVNVYSIDNTLENASSVFTKLLAR